MTTVTSISEAYVFVPNIGHCEIKRYLDLVKRRTDEALTDGLKSSPFLIYMNEQKNKYSLWEIPCDGLRGSSGIDRYQFQEIYFIPPLTIGTYIRYTRLSPILSIADIPNGIYVITEIIHDYIHPKPAYRYICYHIEDISNSGVTRTIRKHENLNSIEILTPVVPIIKKLILSTAPQTSPLLTMWEERESLHEDDIHSFSINGHLVHCVAASLFSPAINAQINMTGMVGSREATYSCDEICTEMFIHLMYNYSLHGYNIDLINKDSLQQLFDMCDYYRTDSGEYISSLMIGMDNEGASKEAIGASKEVIRGE